MENCKFTGEDCWEKINLHYYLEVCIRCGKRKRESRGMNMSFPDNIVAMDEDGRMFLNGDEI